MGSKRNKEMKTIKIISTVNSSISTPSGVIETASYCCNIAKRNCNKRKYTEAWLCIKTAIDLVDCLEVT